MDTDDLEKWDADKLLTVIGAAESAHKSLEKLGESYDGTKRSLEDWGGQTAEAWRAQHGKVRTDITEQGWQAAQVVRALRPLYNEVRAVKTEYEEIKGIVQRNQWAMAKDGSITAPNSPKGEDYQNTMNRQMLEARAKALLKKAEGVDLDIAAALRAITSGGIPTTGHTGQPAPAPKPEPAPAPKPDKDPSVLASGPVAGPDGNPPYKNGATPTMIQGAKSIPLGDNPPGYDQLGPGAQRDQNWKEYLSGKEANGAQRASGMMPTMLPKPEAVEDKGLRSIGAAGRQQGVSYAWGANQSPEGPTHGTLKWDTDGGAHQYGDDKRVGYDCGGLVRFSIFQGSGVDLGMGSNAIDTNDNLAPIKGGIPSASIGQYAQVGDVLVFGGNHSGPFSGDATTHTGIYVGNGLMINAPQSGSPIRLDNAFNDTRITDVLRLKP
ncbi:cell wall-associated NlpC family hydrolase [Mycobacteroides chelonae]|nr:cell wall-associated NlpC family hydrolase [Mycobacteroides chelonae]